MPSVFSNGTNVTTTTHTKHIQYITCSGCRKKDVRKIKKNFYKNGWYCGECLDNKLFNDFVKGFSNPAFRIHNHRQDNKLLLGLELETESLDKKVGFKAKKFDDFLRKEKIVDFYHLKQDCSLTEGMEIITHPFSLEYMKEKRLLTKALAFLRRYKFDKHNQSKRAGIHIHLNREYFITSELIKMRIFFSLNQLNLFRLSGRKKIDNHYCNYEPFDMEKLDICDFSCTKYLALNFHTDNQKTVEIRIFSSTLDLRRIMSYLEFANAISQYVKKASKTDILGEEFGNARKSWRLFTKFVKANKYKYLTKIINKL